MSYASPHNYICSSDHNTTFLYYLCKLLVSLEVLVLLEWTFPRSAVALIHCLVRLAVSRFGTHPLSSLDLVVTELQLCTDVFAR